MTAEPRRAYRVGDWVWWDARGELTFGHPDVRIGMVAREVDYEKDEGGRVHRAWLPLDWNRRVDVATVKPFDLGGVAGQLRALGWLMDERQWPPGSEIDNLVVQAERWLEAIDNCYRPETEPGTIADLRRLCQLVIKRAAERRTFLTQTAPCLATALGWAGICAAAAKKALTETRVAVAAKALEAKTNIPHDHASGDIGYADGLYDALAVIDGILHPPKLPKETANV